MSTKVLYQAISSRFEGDSFLFGPFDSVELANDHFREQCEGGDLDYTSFKPVYLNATDAVPGTWMETARRPLLESPRLFTVDSVDQEEEL